MTRDPSLRFLPNLPRRAFAGLLAGLALASCGVPGTGPHPAPLATLAARSALPGEPEGQWPADGWWRTYGDPQLDAIEDEGLAHSPDIGAALARLASADALARQAGAALLPGVDAAGTAGLSKQSYNLGYPPQFVSLLPHGWNGEGNLDLTFGFDPDIWGRDRAALAAATSEREARAVEARQAALMLSTAIAEAYADLAAAITLADNRQAALDTRSLSQQLIGQRVKEGLENQASLHTAQAVSASARGDLDAAQAAVLLRRHQLAALLGEGPDRGLAVAAPRLAPLAPAPLPADVTTALVARRADIAAARARVVAAASRIRQARADFFPALRLNALVGLQAIGLGNLVNGGSTYGTVGPALSLPLFEGGALRAAYRGASADYDLAVADYDRTVVDAYQQLADAVTSRASTARQLDAARAAEQESQQAYDLAMARYRGGLSTYLDALTVEDRLVEARQALALADAAYRSADIALVRALGGGFAAGAAPGAIADRTQARGLIKDSPK
ncbi:MAG: efflux transporter outer membrane subunit [Sphingomonadales bacterium]|nr:efflux transporter outer membrane subunit [Sphingomonadales bacterium]